MKTIIILFFFIAPIFAGFAQFGIPGGGGGTGGINPDAPDPTGGNSGEVPGGAGGGIPGMGSDGCTMNIWCLLITTVVKESTKRLSIKEKRKEIKKQWAIEAYEQIERKLQKLNFDKIITFLEENKKYFEEFYKNLKEANTSYQVWRKVLDIVEKQSAIGEIYSKIGELGEKTEYFSDDEITAIEVILEQIFKDSEDNIEQLWLIIKSLTDDQVRDAERLEWVSAIEKRVDKNQTDLRELREFVNFISTQRQLAIKGNEDIKKIYNLGQ